jgi:LPS-assembly protein
MTLAALLLSITLFSAPNYSSNRIFYSTLTNIDQVPVITSKTDTPPPPRRGIREKIDTTGKLVTVTDTVDLKLSKDSLDAPVEYSASDSMVMDVPKKTITLYNKANVKYKDIVLDAGIINLDQPTEIVYAYYFLDTAGNKIGIPKFVQGENNMESDSISFNFKSQKGITKTTFTKQAEMFVQGEKIKKVSINEYFAYRAQFTTCDLDKPHFAFRTKKMKFVNQKLGVSGPIHPEFEGVPVPVYIPFGFFPLSQGRHSGLLAPQFSNNRQFGLGLEGLGYYKVLNDYFDVTLRTDIYSYGGYRVNVTPTYRARYRYQGALTFSYQNSRILNDFGKQEFNSTKTFNVSWNHTVDSRARPGQTFSASVNAGSTKYNRLQANNPIQNFNNQLSSSISYSKNWNNKYNLTLSANHQQNNQSGLIGFSLPNGSFTVSNFYPFQKKEFVGEAKWYEKLGIGINTNFSNQASVYDSLFSFKKLVDTFQWGAQHNIPITVALPLNGPIQVSPGISFRENWYSRKFIRQWNSSKNKVDTTITRGFNRSSDISFSLGVNTAIFGTYDKFKKTSRLMAIRHVIRPTVSASYNPGLARKDVYKSKIDTSGREFEFNYFDGAVGGTLSSQKFGGLSFGVDNNIEMKVRSKKDTGEAAIKKIRLIDGFGINGSYNFIADSFNLSTFQLYVRSTLFEKINISANASLDPYLVDSLGFRRPKLIWTEGKFKPGRLTNGNIAISTSFQSKPKDDTKKKEIEDGIDDRNNPQQVTLEEQQAQLQYVRSNPSEFADFNIPWSINLSYSLNFNREIKPDYSGFRTVISSNVSVNGDFNLTPKWKIGASTYYDFRGSGLQNTTLFISREMHCWQLAINYTRGIYNSFNITINPKSALLRDLRINRSRYFYNQQ